MSRWTSVPNLSDEGHLIQELLAGTHTERQTHRIVCSHVLGTRCDRHRKLFVHPWHRSSRRSHRVFTALSFDSRPLARRTQVYGYHARNHENTATIRIKAEMHESTVTAVMVAQQPSHAEIANKIFLRTLLTSNRHRASTSMYSLTFRLRVMLSQQCNRCPDCKSAQ